MELSQGKQSKSGKKAREEKGKDGKKEENGGVELFDCFAFLLSPTLFSQSFYFLAVSHNMKCVWLYESKCALSLMGCQSTRGILGDIYSHTDRRVRSN